MLHNKMTLSTPLYTRIVVYYNIQRVIQHNKLSRVKKLAFQKRKAHFNIAFTNKMQPFKTIALS